MALASITVYVLADVDVCGTKESTLTEPVSVRFVDCQICGSVRFVLVIGLKSYFMI